MSIRKCFRRGNICQLKFKFFNNIKHFISLDPVSRVKQIFESNLRTAEELLNRIVNSPTMFYEEEWNSFFKFLKNISMFFTRSTGSLNYLQLVFPCLVTMKERVKNIKMNYDILLDLSLTLYKYACEMKFMYGFDNSLIRDFDGLLDILQRIVMDQNYDERDFKMFKDLNNLAYAAFYNGIGQPVRAKTKLQEFFEEYGKETYTANLPYKRSIIIGLYFYQMAVAMEKDDDPILVKTAIDYLISAHGEIRYIAVNAIYEFPFYCCLVAGKFFASRLF